MSKLVHIGETETREMIEDPAPPAPEFDKAARDAARKAGLTEAEIVDAFGPPVPSN